MLSMQSDATNGTTSLLTSRLSSVSAVIVAHGSGLDATLVHAFVNTLSSYCVETETIILASGIDDLGFVALKQLVAELSDCSCYVIPEPIDAEEARIFGMEAAVGDYVLLVNGSALGAIIVALPATIRSLKNGFDLVTALPQEPPDKPSARGVMERLAYFLLSMLSGLSISQTPSDLFALSREASLHILSKPNAGLLLKARTAGRGFPASTIAGAYEKPAVPIDRRPFARRASTAIRLLVSIGAAPIRLVSIISIASSVLSVLYAIYVVIIYFTKPNVASGWTTLSLQISGMMFLFSVMLALLSEYIVQIYTSTAARRRRQVVRELRSEKTARHDRPNVICETGGYRFGAPRDFLEPRQRP
jgi:hypothetical protein